VSETEADAVVGNMVTMFRDPKQRMASTFASLVVAPNYFAGAGPPNNEGIGWGWSDKADYFAMRTQIDHGATFDQTELRKYTGCQVHMTLGHGCMSRHAYAGEADAAVVQRAIARVKRFRFVGLVDEWLLSICLFNFQMTGRRFVSDDQLADTHATNASSKNITEYDVAGYPDDPLDDGLYAWVKAEFQRRLKKFDISEENCPRSDAKHNAKSPNTALLRYSDDWYPETPPAAAVAPALPYDSAPAAAAVPALPSLSDAALCPAGVPGWTNFTAVCCDASCGECGGPAREDPARPDDMLAPCNERPGGDAACCTGTIIASGGRPCALRNDTRCIGVAAEAVVAPPPPRLSVSAVSTAPPNSTAGEAHPRILGLVASPCVLAGSQTNARLLDTLRRGCARYPGLRLVLNIFDVEAADAGRCDVEGGALFASSSGPPPCIVNVTHVLGDKALFWEAAATPEVLDRGEYEYVFAFDNDMRIADDDFDLERAATLLQRSGAGLGQPRIRLSAEAGANARAFPAPADVAAAVAAPAGVGGGNGTAAGDGNGTAAVSRAVRLNGNARAFRSGADAKGVHFPEGTWRFLVDPLPAGCGAQQLDFVENQAPLFTSRAWRAVHTQLLGRLDRAIFNTSNYGLSATWCRLVQRYSGHAIGCALLDEQLVTTDERTIEQLGLSSVIRSGERCLDFVRRTWRAEYLDAGARGGREYTRGECVLPLANA